MLRRTSKLKRAARHSGSPAQPDHRRASRWIALAAGVAATVGALAILCSDALRSGKWELEHGLMPIIVGITIVSGHLIGSAMRERKVLASIGFVALFCLGTFATIYNSVGRQAATSDTEVLSVIDHNAQRDQTLRDLATSKSRLATANQMVDHETNNGGCGKKCEDWKQRATEVSSHVAILEEKLKLVGPTLVAAPKADRAARVASLFGFERTRTKEVFHLVEPFLYALLFELAAIVAFGFGFAPLRVAVPPANDNGRLIDPVIHKEPSKTPVPQAQTSAHPRATSTARATPIRDRKDATIAQIAAWLDQGRRFDSQELLREALNASGKFGEIPRSTLSDWLIECGHNIVRTPDGRRKAVG